MGTSMLLPDREVAFVKAMMSPLENQGWVINIKRSLEVGMGVAKKRMRYPS